MDAEVLEAMADAFEHLAAGREGGWSEREPGLLVVHTGAPLPTLVATPPACFRPVVTVETWRPSAG